MRLSRHVDAEEQLLLSNCQPPVDAFSSADACDAAMIRQECSLSSSGSEYRTFGPLADKPLRKTRVVARGRGKPTAQPVHLARTCSILGAASLSARHNGGLFQHQARQWSRPEAGSPCPQPDSSCLLPEAGCVRQLECRAHDLASPLVTC